MNAVTEHQEEVGKILPGPIETKVTIIVNMLYDNPLSKWAKANTRIAKPARKRARLS